MTIGEKLSRLRKENNLTQEQVADLLGVSRQAVSKWESGVTFPETEKLIRLSDLYGCSIDYLLKENAERAEAPCEEKTAEPGRLPFSIFRLPERKSEKTLWGLPLYHIGRKARGIFALGLDARGVVAVGLMARGAVSAGLLSIGVLSFGLLSIGLAALGVFALGLIAAGAVTAGILALGAICFGVFSIGAVAIGDFSVGALAIGKYAALGDHAKAMIALGDSEASGTLFEKVGELSPKDIASVAELLDSIVPAWLAWAKAMFRNFI